MVLGNIDIGFQSVSILNVLFQWSCFIQQVDLVKEILRNIAKIGILNKLPP